MGSLEEDELVRLVQDFMESESPSSTGSSSSASRNLNHRTQYFILQDVLRSETIEEAKVLKCVVKHMKRRRETKKNTSLRNWLVMKLKMDGLHASLCPTSWATSLGCPAGEYEYIEVMNEDENRKRVRLIVDMDFRSQFELARPTQFYTEMTDSLPLIFVGTESKLCNIISILCSAAKQSLRQQGLHVPPWRTTSYMHSKWLSLSHTQLGHGRHRQEEEDEYVVAPKDGAPSGGVPMWVPPPPMVKPRKMDVAANGSALSSQFSNINTNCCEV